VRNKSIGTTSATMSFAKPELDGLIDEDILARFKDCPVKYETIINAQLIKTLRVLTEVVECKKL